MKGGSAQSSSSIHRWLSRTSNTAATALDDDANVKFKSNDFSPPPLTDSSSTTASASTILTPTTSVAPSLPHWKSFRNVTGKKPCAPPTTHAKLPVVPTSQKLAASLPVASHASALVLARTDIKLHRILNHDPTRRVLLFDISLPSSFIRQQASAATSSSSMSIVVRRPLPAIQPHSITTPHLVPEHDLSQFATTPPVTRIRITCDLIPWKIDVRGRTTLPNDPTSFVRVIDVLDGIYKSLREGVTSTEWNRADPAFRDQVKKAYSRRCHASRSFTLTGYEEKQGVRRIDYLQDKTMFLGLTIKNPGGGESDCTRSNVAEEYYSLSELVCLARFSSSGLHHMHWAAQTLSCRSLTTNCSSTVPSCYDFQYNMTYFSRTELLDCRLGILRMLLLRHRIHDRPTC